MLQHSEVSAGSDELHFPTFVYKTDDLQLRQNHHLPSPVGVIGHFELKNKNKRTNHNTKPQWQKLQMFLFFLFLEEYLVVRNMES